MRFDPPKSIINALKKKYQDSHVESIIKDFLAELVQYCIDHTACTINGLGKFIMYKTFCSRTGTIRPRFKFRSSRSFIEKIGKDSFIMEKLKMSFEKHEFTEKNAERCKLHKEIRDANARFLDRSRMLREDGEEQRLVAQYIDDLISSDDEEDTEEIKE